MFKSLLAVAALVVASSALTCSWSAGSCNLPSTHGFYANQAMCEVACLASPLKGCCGFFGYACSGSISGMSAYVGAAPAGFGGPLAATCALDTSDDPFHTTGPNGGGNGRRLAVNVDDLPYAPSPLQLAPVLSSHDQCSNNAVAAGHVKPSASWSASVISCMEGDGTMVAGQPVVQSSRHSVRVNAVEQRSDSDRRAATDGDEQSAQAGAAPMDVALGAAAAALLVLLVALVLRLRRRSEEEEQA
eukprot:PLAT13464.1.p1 GENE.PLAT13464.1~~PLAT13464.1.p1  ORF type:complete len:245 (+),score=71.50 PLAT13464.1:3-737(+)